MKTYLDSDFYQKPMTSQTQLAKHWGISQQKISKMVAEGVLRLNKANRIPMKEVMEAEGLGLHEKEEIGYRKLYRDYQKLEEENRKLRVLITNIKTVLGDVQGGE